MSWKKMIIGEKMPDKNDPKYKERYEQEVETGKKFARFTRLDRLAAIVQRFANEHRNLFLALVFGTVICCFTFNIYRFAMVCNSKGHNTTATERQDSLLKKIHEKRHKQFHEEKAKLDKEKKLNPQTQNNDSE